MNHSTSTSNRSSDVGRLGEELVARWWRSQGWVVLQRRWHCRWGELDLVVGQPSEQTPTVYQSIAFVEVKTRQKGNWDSDGALAMTRRKQTKLWKTAQLFLVAHPALAELPCRFDVALVNWRSFPQGVPSHKPAAIPTSLMDNGYRLELQEYIQGAFTL